MEITYGVAILGNRRKSLATCSAPHKAKPSLRVRKTPTKDEGAS